MSITPISITELLKEIPDPHLGWFEEQSREFYKNGDYDKTARCLIACCIYGESSDADGYLFDIDETTEYWVGQPEKFTHAELTYCEQILIPKIISQWIVIKEPADY
jgi:hypothetical protein